MVMATIYDRPGSGLDVQDYGSSTKCYKCEKKSSKIEWIWRDFECRQYYVCGEHVKGLEGAKAMFATQYGWRDLEEVEEVE